VTLYKGLVILTARITLIFNMADFVSFGEVLLRLSTQNAQLITQANGLDVVYGGSEANVASALAQWGVSACHVTQLPEHAIGVAAKQSLKRYGVETNHIGDKPGRIGIYFLEHGSSMRAPNIIYDRFNSVFENIEPSDFNWEKILDGAKWFHWSGITPAVSAKVAQACNDAITVARRKRICISGDINYRRVLWNYGKSPREIMPELISKCDWIIGGATDFENCLGIKVDNLSFEEVCIEVKKVNAQLKYISTTNRSTFSATHNNLQGVLWNGTSCMNSKIYDINPIVDRIGSGDAFMAGLVFGALSNFPENKLVEFATAAAAYKHTIPGDVLVARVNEIEGIVSEKNIGKLLR
jgi:2-dehydro-3-deoxygluconokinase